MDMVNQYQPPKYIEIHPPFSDYTPSMSDFIDKYSVFEDLILEKYPQTQILIENRSGSTYKGGTFILSAADSFLELSDLISSNKLKLRITFDVPQLCTAHDIDTMNGQTELLETLFSDIMNCRESISGVHLWGKKISESGSKTPHIGDLNTYFNNNCECKEKFLSDLHNLFDDEVIRNMVLEVNSGNDDMISIINDLKKAGFRFI
ncbi:hypothetical protein [Methanolapillus africanus]